MFPISLQVFYSILNGFDYECLFYYLFLFRNFSENRDFISSGICESPIFLSSLTSTIVPNVLDDVISHVSINNRNK